ncbi:MAG: hypothetical protein AAB348_02045 [Patescibacteria group bacterium]
MKLRGTLLFIIVIFVWMSSAKPTYGLMSSTNYTIFADSIDAGGVLSAGGAYSLEDTIGESPEGVATSSVYEIRGGYQAMDWRTISLSLSANAINLGQLSVANISSASATATITTDSVSGYSLSISSVSGAPLTAVADGVVTAGQEEYGVAVSGTGSSFADDRAIAAGQNLSSASTAVTNSNVILTFKAAIRIQTTSGGRSQSLTLTASANL